MAMALNPEVQARAQEELDRVLPDTLPTLAHQKDLPYIAALVKEVFRWHPATTLGRSLVHSIFLYTERASTT